MRHRIFKNIVKQGFQGMWRNRTMGLASVGSITAVLVILGMVLIIVLSINNVVIETKNKFDEIQVFLDDNADEEQLTKIENRIKETDGVNSVVFQSKEQALNIMKKEWGDEGYLLEGLEENPLPNSYVIQLKDIKYADNVVDKIKGMSGIEEIKYYKDIIDKMLTVSRYIKIGGIAIIAILMFISVFIISNTIKITVAARRREISIMKYVGATNGYIRGPFIIEGILLGVVGAGLSILIVNFGYKYLFKVINERLYIIFTVYLVSPYVLFQDIVIIFLAIGIGIGVLGSLLSLKRFLDV
ncbi:MULTISPECIES: permease-like cell division protein FtsX [Tissierellales]|uniref:Cell division protein FtsX n=1 Tax=Acidilutibacter cellobiosedens TaxID=2507161 RepID=A0A410QA76_9FIRM|nr:MULTISPECIES: permease-like cell division protein FtsX [Tissierellales]MBE6081466.1 ABC transporter permease [Tissierellaceae bacterium]QAT60912.1 ABC transporter permease [Acidilutibacter cellobiosedens]SCL90802.1 Cell division protein FtsX [Sporanaerobacter sp. PP17-6a]